MQYPKQPSTVHVETLDGELCLYDWQRMKVHNLNPTAARVWELCDGQTTPQEMAAQLYGDLTPAQAEELVWLTLKRLEQEHLLENKVVQPSGRKVYSRREMLAKLGVAAMMLPVISTIVAPGPVAAQSPGGGAPVTCPIVRTANVGTTDAVAGYQYYAFNEGPITDAQIRGCGITSITYAWTGVAAQPGGNAIALANANNVRADTGHVFVPGDTSPQSPTLYGSFYWTGNRPYNGVDIDGTNAWNVGVLTVTLA